MTNRYPRNWAKYDLCIKCPVEPGCDISDELVSFVRKLSDSIGNQYKNAYLSEYDGKFTILIRGGTKFLYSKAVKDSWELLLDPDIIHVMASRGNSSHFIKPFTMNHVPEISSISPYQYIYAPYKSDISIKHLYACHINSTSPFNKTVRLRMILDFLRNDIVKEKNPSQSFIRENDEDTEDLDDNLPPIPQELGMYAISHLLYYGIIRDVYAVHDFSEISSLKMRVFSLKSVLGLPYDVIRDYLGESVAFDVAFFDYMLLSLGLLTCTGIAFQVLCVYYNDFASLPELPPFAFSIPFSFVFILQYWKRLEQIFAMKWNTAHQLDRENETHYNHNNEVRPDFQGELLHSPVTGDVIMYYGLSCRIRTQTFIGRTISFLVFVLCIIGLLISNAGIYYGRYQLRQFDSLESYVQYIASGGNAVVNIVYHQIFLWIAYGITLLENHRTDYNFQCSLSVKAIIFQFVSTTASSYYLAFGAAYVKPRNEPISSVGECGYDNCMFPVTINMMVFLFVEGVWRVLSTYLWPSLCICFSSCIHYKRYNYERALERQISATHSQHDMKPILKRLPSKSQANNQSIYRDISEDYLKRSTSQFDQVNHMKDSEEFRQRLASIRSPSPSRPPPEPSWVDQLKPTTKEEVNRTSDSFRVDLNDESRTTSEDEGERREGGVEKERPQFFSSNDNDSSDLEPPGTSARNNNTNNTNTNNRSQQFHLNMNTSSRSQGGFSSAGDPTPPPSPSRRQQEADQSHHSDHSRRYSNIHRFYDDFPATEPVEGEEEEMEENRQQDEGDDEENPRIYSKRAPFERYSGRSYDVDDHHLKNQLFVFRIMSLCLCFGVALPACFAALMLMLFLETRIEIWQLLDYYPRNLPKVASSIGWIWTISYDALLLASIGTNACLIIFTMKDQAYSDWSVSHQLLLWIGIVLTLIVFQMLCHFWFSQVPKEVKVQLSRKAMVTRKLIDRLPDHEDSLPIEML